VGDRPITGEYHEKGYPLSDKDDIYSYEKMRDMTVPYAQRTTDIIAIETGLEVNVKTYILMSCSIYGIGANPLHEFCQVPKLIRLALETGQAAVVGDGKATWDHVHITDVGRLYKLVVAKILAGADIPNGKKGIYFVEAGHHSWLELSQRIAEAGVALGALKTTAIQSLSLEEATKKLANNWALIGELGWASKYVSSSPSAALETSYIPVC
jgi:nucleoside-diphosphate-sugar epimerase